MKRKTLFTVAILAAIAFSAQAGGRDSDVRQERRSEPNWIIERQRGYQVQGVPTERIIIGRREIDVYRNGLMFEKGNVVGIKP